MATKQPDLQANEEFVREMSDAIWGADGSPEKVDDYFAEDVVAHEPGETFQGREAYKANEAELRRGMPDLEGSVELVICQDDLVAVTYEASGTHEGSLWGIEPTGKSGSISGMAVYRIRDDEVVETWHEYDRLGMFQQLGLIPEDPTA